VYAHHAIFSDGYHGDNATLIDQLLPVLRNRIDLYLSGHEHDMQHLRPVDGVTFVTSGGGGSDLRPPRPTSRSFFAKAAFGFTILEASPTELNVRFVGADSKVMHQFTLQKASAPQTNVTQRH
jgi:tartrate-resistant acid phosphatase type 5